MHGFSVWAKKGNKDWVYIASSTTDVNCFFNVNAPAVGTAAAGVTTAGIEPHPYLAGWYRCWVIFTGSTDAKSFGLYAAHADGDADFAGDASTTNCYFWGCQVEAVTEHFPSSYIPTVAAAVTRNKDEFATNVRLPIVGNIDDLPQALTIGGSDYDPCAYLVADDIQADGTWASRHDVSKTLAFAGAGTNPTRQWDAVSRANRSAKYWASNYHKAADTTWGQITTGDWAFELIFSPFTTTTGMIFSSFNGSTAGLLAYWNGTSVIADVLYNSVEYARVTGAVTSKSLCHVFCGGDYSDAYYTWVNGIYVNSKSLAGATGSGAGSALTIGAHPSGANNGDHAIAQLGIWDLPANPWPGAATNQAVMGAIARARFNQLFRYQSCRLDCDILHPNVNRQADANLVDAGISANDRMTIGLTAADVLSSVGTANGSAQWSMAGSTDIAANVRRKLSVRARLNSASANVDNASEATDAACEVPAGITRVFVGELLDGTLQPGCLVSSIKLSRSDR
jgi:hypothetical protein